MDEQHAKQLRDLQSMLTEGAIDKPQYQQLSRAAMDEALSRSRSRAAQNSLKEEEARQASAQLGAACRPATAATAAAASVNATSVIATPVESLPMLEPAEACLPTTPVVTSTVPVAGVCNCM